MKKTRNIINIDEEKCNGCGNCIIACPEQAIQILDTPNGPKAKLVRDFYCDGLGACLGSCPTGALTIEVKDVEDYDEDATVSRIKEVAPEMLEIHLKHMKEHVQKLQENPSEHKFGMTGCPGSRTISWGEKKSGKDEKESQKEKQNSELRQWPIQLTLINPSAPYFQNADLLIAADCVPFAYANFHQDFLKEKSIIIGCPKLDDTNFYQEKLTELFKLSNIKTITVLNMEVPCCFGLQHLVKESIKASGKNIPYSEIVISIKGEKI